MRPRRTQKWRDRVTSLQSPTRLPHFSRNIRRIPTKLRAHFGRPTHPSPSKMLATSKMLDDEWSATSSSDDGSTATSAPLSANALILSCMFPSQCPPAATAMVRELYAPSTWRTFRRVAMRIVDHACIEPSQLPQLMSDWVVSGSGPVSTWIFSRGQFAALAAIDAKKLHVLFTKDLAQILSAARAVTKPLPRRAPPLSRELIDRAVLVARTTGHCEMAAYMLLDWKSASRAGDWTGLPAVQTKVLSGTELFVWFGKSRDPMATTRATKSTRRRGERADLAVILTETAGWPLWLVSFLDQRRRASGVVTAFSSQDMLRFIRRVLPPPPPVLDPTDETTVPLRAEWGAHSVKRGTMACLSQAVHSGLVSPAARDILLKHRSEAAKTLGGDAMATYMTDRVSLARHTMTDKTSAVL